MSLDYVVRGVIPPPSWEPTAGQTVYVSGVKTRISRTGSEGGVPYVWLRPAVYGTFAMNVRNLKAVARIPQDVASALIPKEYATFRRRSNPIPTRWTDARVMRTRSGQVKVMLPMKRNPRPKPRYRVIRSKTTRGESTWIIVNQRGEQVGALAGYTTKRIALDRARRM